eukprot:gnl/Spiro4/8175_TR4308_c0_g1_i1.p1 gnl/Spiro4/8175_TR4308_c0_g1~~gnl/Spiro4/8175_TR4308_c0_g1_i1.p1  ORF type:complete len:443 (-),score=112.86 gnl/Spiro4/8175_TR4308_c0_g1_i1:13-1341(-)
MPPKRRAPPARRSSTSSESDGEGSPPPAAAPCSDTPTWTPGIWSKGDATEPEHTRRTRACVAVEASAGVWHDDNSLVWWQHPGARPSSKIWAFDMDGTLINPKGKGKFPVNRADWQWWHPNVVTKLRSAADNGFKIVIFTNQKGISTGRQRQSDITGKIEDISRELNVPLTAFIATRDDRNRKPSPAMWAFHRDHCNGGLPIDPFDSVFVGDAAGRHDSWAPQKKKDFDCTDRKFAANIGVRFQTPEEFFLNEPPTPNFDWNGITKDQLFALERQPKLSARTWHRAGPELVVMCGAPASGKSTFCKRFLVPHGYERVNRDTLKTKERCVKACQQALAEGKSVCIDNTNPAPEDRALYLNLAKKNGVPARCFVLQTPLPVAHHNNLYREQTDGTEHVPEIAYRSFKGKFKPPTASEGFAEILEIPFVPEFDSDEARNCFFMYT